MGPDGRVLSPIRVFGSDRVLIEEDKDYVTMIMLEHPEGMLLCLRSGRPDAGDGVRYSRGADDGGPTWCQPRCRA